MSFFIRQDIERLYVIKMVLPGDTVIHKIGMTHSNRSTDRMMEILRSWFVNFRFVPYTELKLDMQCQSSDKLERYIHWLLADYRFEPTHKVDGATEMFIDLDEIRVIQFLKAYNNSMFVDPPSMTETERVVISNLLTQ